MAWTAFALSREHPSAAVGTARELPSVAVNGRSGVVGSSNYSLLQEVTGLMPATWAVLMSSILGIDLQLAWVDDWLWLIILWYRSNWRRERARARVLSFPFKVPVMTYLNVSWRWLSCTQEPILCPIKTAGTLCPRFTRLCERTHEIAGEPRSSRRVCTWSQHRVFQENGHKVPVITFPARFSPCKMPILCP